MVRDNAASAVCTMVKRFPIHPSHPERNCWGCDKYCAAHEMLCGNGSVRTPHPVEVFGDDWAEWGLDAPAAPGDAPASQPLAAAPPLALTRAT